MTTYPFTVLIGLLPGLPGSPESLVISDAYYQNKINISGILFEMKE